MAFRTARTVTPTSAKTAIHIVAMPRTARTRTRSFMNMAKKVFSLARRRVLRAILTPTTIFDGLSSISTTSAASIAASDPRPPIAIPRSALASTGASLIPSPTNARVFPAGFSFRNRYDQFTLFTNSCIRFNTL